MMIDQFNQGRLGQWFRHTSATLEVVGALALLPPVYARYCSSWWILARWRLS